ncbi:MAG TPA: serine/threonine protein kinase [Dehalococcoidia bacterium]|jgi:glycine amidinotransferase|nr:serine/threonine protein kinase [Dehalococcoidia bacterium]
MAKIVNSWNEWDPLKHVIIGRPEGTNVPAPEPAWWYDLPEGEYPLPTYGPFPQEMVDAANEQMDYFVSVLEKRGVKVDRAIIHPCMYNKPVSTPDWTQLNCHGVNNVRDVFLVHGKYIIEATTCRRSRWYEYLNLRPHFERFFKEDPEMVWFTAPKPRLTDESYVKNYYYYFNNVWTDEEKRDRLYNWEFQLTEKEPLWDAADAMRFGKDIFHQGSCVTNKSGMDWLKRMFAELGIRVHHVLFDTPWPPSPDRPDNYHPWHIDVNLVPLRPGLCMYNPDWKPRTPELWELFKINDWELIPAARPTYVHKNKVYLTGLYEGKSWISMNTFSIDPKTVCVEAHETAYCEQLDKLGFEVIPIPYEKVIPFGGALHCTTLDIYREGKLEDYFPKQIPGY